MQFDNTHGAHGFSACPNEVVSAILLSCDTADLHSLSRVNKRLHNVANDLLYSSIQFTWTPATIPPVTLFLRSILSNPQLTENVRSLSLTGDKPCFYDGQYSNLSVPLPKASWTEAESALDIAVNLIADIQVPHSEEWIHELRDGTMDAIVAVLVARLPTLRSFHLGKNFGRDIALLGAMFQSSISKTQVGWLPRFHLLQDISTYFYRNYWLQADANTPLQLPFFYLQAVRSLDLCLDNPVIFSWPSGTPDPTNLTSLKLRYVREGSLKCILATTTRLKKLDWEFLYSERNMTAPGSNHLMYPPQDNILYPPLADLDQICDALIPVRDTLLDLTLRADAVQPVNLCWMSKIEIRGSLSKLVEFEKIERFQVPLPFLAGRLVPNNYFRIPARLPKNIRKLHITNDLEYFWSQFETDPNEDDEWEEMSLYINLRLWFYKWRASTPRFQHLELSVEQGYWEENKRQALRDLCEEDRVQVALTFRGLPPFNGFPPFNPPPFDEYLVE